MKVFLRGKRHPVTLSKSDFVTQGGEASIYIKQDTVFKVHLDRNRVTSEAKIVELKELDCEEIIRPFDLLVDQTDRPIGVTMRFVKDAIALCKLFTTDFWRRNGIGVSDISHIVDYIRKTIAFIHSHKGFLIVDGNEFNYLVGPKMLGAKKSAFDVPYFIDVDSYQTPSFPATAIMATVKDWHTKGFDHGSDWFSFAVVAFQLFAGIHPYRGRHPDFQKGDMESRMKANVSVFHKDVSCPPPMRPISSIPGNYAQWFLDVFELGKRTEPPKVSGKAEAVEVTAAVVGAMDSFEIKKIGQFQSEILYYGMNGQDEIVKLADGSIFINKKRYANMEGYEVVFSPKTRTPFFLKLSDGLIYTNGFTGSVKVPAKDMMVIEDRYYTLSQEKLFEWSIFEPLPGQFIPHGITQTMNVLPHATTMFSGVVHMNVLGVHHFIMPEPGVKSGEAGKFHMKELRELDGHRIIDAKRIETVLAVTSHKGGKYNRFIFRFSQEKTHDVMTFNDIPYAGINMAVIKSRGVLLIVDPDGVLSLMKARPHMKPAMQFKGFDPNVRLYATGTKAVFTKGNALYSISMK